LLFRAINSFLITEQIAESMPKKNRKDFGNGMLQSSRKSHSWGTGRDLFMQVQVENLLFSLNKIER